MSLDFDLVQDRPISIFSVNMTGNVCPMWVKANVYHLLYESDGMPAQSIMSGLKKGIDDMEEKASEYKKLNPINGWGSYDGALKFLKEILTACKENPQATISISR